MSYLITYNDAIKLCDAYKNFNYHKTEHRIDGYRVVTFNYFMCDYNVFIKPLRENPEINGLDMRGVTFVFNEDGTLYKRFLMLKKFFNLNQVSETQYDLLKDKKIDLVTSKEDGSLIAFMKLPNGTIFAKTQGGFTNEQSVAAMELYNTQKGVRKFVNMSLSAGFTPLFEYVSYDNRIVLKYKEKELRLIGIRDNDNGQYYSAGVMHLEKNFDNLSAVQPIHFNSLDEIISLMKTSTDIEGVVIHFDDGQMVKIKTDWYWNAHNFRDKVNRENDIIQLIVDNKIDDFLSTIDEPEFIKQINNIHSFVNNYIINKCKEVEDLCKSYTGDKKIFVITNKGNKNLSLALQYLFYNKSLRYIISSYLKTKTSKLSSAREFLKTGRI